MRAAYRRSLPLTPAFAATVALAWLGCASERPGVGGGGAGGDGGDGGAGAASSSVSTGTGVVVTEPDGPPRLTVVHGVVDTPSIRLCFLPWPDPPAGIVPWPAEPIPFGGSAALALPDPTLPEGSDVLVTVVAGDLGGADCAALFADPSVAPGARVGAVGVFPEGSFDAARSVLFAPTGCLEPGHVDDATPSLCGALYDPGEPALGATIAILSRLTYPERVSLQAVHAASPSFTLDLGVRPSFDGAEPVMIATSLPPGAIAPSPAFAPISTAELGSTAGATAIGSVTGAPASAVELSMAGVLAAGGLDGNALGNGRGVALVALGAPPSGPSVSWSQSFRVVAVRPDPLP